MEDRETTQSALKEYKVMQLSGIAVCGAGIIAALADSPIGAAVAITVGIATYVTGLLGVWWNTGD